MNRTDLRNSNDIVNIVRNTLQRHNDKIENTMETVKGVIDEVRLHKDKALRAYTQKFDGVDIDDFKVSEDEIQSGFDAVDSGFIAILNEAKENIQAYHEKQFYAMDSIEGPHKFLSQIVTPMESVGLYVPGGKSPYPSTVLMNAVPATIAGVHRIVLVTPPGKDGRINANILAAAKICGIHEIYKVGGAQAIAALAYGTESIAPVHKICGPGNLYVTAAKRTVYGDVDIDMLAGPSEILIIADAQANPAFVAADFLSQAEHDENAACILVTTSAELAKAAMQEIETQLEKLSKKAIAAQSIENYGQIFIVDSIQDAFQVSNEVAPEHLEILLENPKDYLAAIKNAGTVFLGSYTPEPVGDYFAGSNHTIPTSGKTKFFSPLSTYDFMKRTSVVYYDQEELAQHKDKIITFAEKEGLTAHANAVRIRFER